MRSLAAFALALLVHACLAACVCGVLRVTPTRVQNLELELSSVTFSSSEEERDALPVQDLPPVAPAPEPPPKASTPPVEPPPPQVSAPEGPALTTDVSPQTEQTRFETPPEAPSVPQAASVPQQAAPQQARIDAEPTLRRTIRPAYPRGARQRGEEGAVTLEIDVSASGRVTDVRVVASSGYGELDAAACQAARKARFTPAQAAGESVASQARIQLKFRLKD